MGNFKSPKQGTAQPTQALPADRPTSQPGVPTTPPAPPTPADAPNLQDGYLTGEGDMDKLRKG